MHLRWGILGLLFLSGCFYNSAWGQRKKAQQHYAERQTAAELAPERASWRSHREVRVRVYIDEAYRRAHPDAEATIGELLERANHVLHDALQVKLVVVDVRPFEASHQGQRLPEVLEQVAELDAGEDVHVVMALVGAAPQITESFHELGYATLLGKHLVLRDLHDSLEYEAFVKQLDELDKEQRMRLFRERRSHKQTTLLLHEFGHVAGAIHSTAPETFMQPAYDHREHSFTAGNLAMMRHGLALLLEEPSDRDVAATASALDQVLNTPAYNQWDKDARLQMLRQLTAMQTGPATTTQPDTHSTAGAAPSAPPTAAGAPGHRVLSTEAASTDGLSESDQAIYEQALSAFHAGELSAAFELAAPLADRNPESYSAQHLACELGMKGATSMQKMRAYCTRLAGPSQ